MAPFGVALNSQFFLPTVNGRMAFSLRLLENCSVHPQDMSSINGYADGISKARILISRGKRRETN